MDSLTEVSYSEIELRWVQALDGPAEVRARQLRGSVGRCFAGDPLFHQHDGSGRALYRYPRIQYRWQDGCGVVAGWGEAAQHLLAIPWLELELLLGDDAVQIDDISLVTHKVRFGVGPRLLRYRLASPALLLNQKNYRRYRELEPAGRRDELDRLLIAQILTAMRGLGVEFDGQLYGAFTQVRSVISRYKQQELVGITGQFVCNAVLPAGFAIGHGVSHGFGWIVPA